MCKVIFVCSSYHAIHYIIYNSNAWEVPFQPQKWKMSKKRWNYEKKKNNKKIENSKTFFQNNNFTMFLCSIAQGNNVDLLIKFYTTFNIVKRVWGKVRKTASAIINGKSSRNNPFINTENIFSPLSFSLMDMFAYIIMWVRKVHITFWICWFFHRMSWKHMFMPFKFVWWWLKLQFFQLFVLMPIHNIQHWIIDQGCSYYTQK